ncbi:MAG TPA: phosphotransferase family protein [Gemmatimonadaceae bacterium]|nr:phosphotransferase family protein [Gemmatimonadaceae bacterium]
MSFGNELDTFLRAHGLWVRSLRRLAGGASQEIWLVHVVNGEDEERDIVLRRDMDGALSTLARTRVEEYALMQAAYDSGVPVPKVFYGPWQLEGRNAFFMDHVAGETIGRRLVRDPAYAQARAALPGQLMRGLVGLHAIDTSELPFLGTPQTAIDLVAALERDLDACGEGHPALELGLRWLRVHAPPLERTALVHGDFRMGNFVVGADGLSGILDWELAHVGDPDEDLGWFCVRAWRFGSDQLAAGGITTREQLLALHREAGGHEVTPERLRYWEIFGNVKWGIVALSQAGRHLRGETVSVELATLGRVAAEMELETLHLLSAGRT